MTENKAIAVLFGFCYFLSWFICQTAHWFGWRSPFDSAFTTAYMETGFVPFFAGDHLMGMILILAGACPLFGLLSAIIIENLEKKERNHV